MNRSKLLMLLLAAALVSGVGCGPREEEPAQGSGETTTAPAPEGSGATTTPEPAVGGGDGATATTTLQGPDANLGGTVTFTQDGYNVKIVAEVKGVPPGKHGIHVHEYGQCEAPTFESAGAHVNPDGAAHGCPGSPEYHPGDLGNIEVGADGTGRLEMSTTALTVTPGSNSVVGKTVILHERFDDCVARPAGNSGGRIACGVIQQTSGPQ